MLGLGLSLAAQRAGVTHTGRLTLQHPPFPASSGLKAQCAVTQLSGRGMENKASSLSLHGVPLLHVPRHGCECMWGWGSEGEQGEAGAGQCSCQADQQAHLFWAGQPCRPSLPREPVTSQQPHPQTSTTGGTEVGEGGGLRAYSRKTEVGLFYEYDWTSWPKA